MNQDALRARYLSDPLPIRLGGLAANLARIESFSNDLQHGEVVEHLLEESKYFIEWIALDVSLEVREGLVDLQRQLAQWQSQWREIWPDSEKRTTVARQAGTWSKWVLERSGLLG